MARSAGIDVKVISVLNRATLESGTSKTKRPGSL